jgi:uncharacterized membrane protein
VATRVPPGPSGILSPTGGAWSRLAISARRTVDVTITGWLIQLAIWIPLIALWVFALADLFRAPVSGVAKALWAIAIVFIPVVGVILYFIFRPAIAGPDLPTATTDQHVATLEELKRRGVIGDEEYEKYRWEITGGA